MCFIDTARLVELPHEPGLDVVADWLLFASAGDSIELRAIPSVPDLHAYISGMRGRIAGVQERDSSGNTAPYVRFRSTEGSAVIAHISMYDGLRDTVEYTLVVRHIPAPSTPRSMLMTGAAAGLTITSAYELDEFIIAPLSLARSRSDSRYWTAFPRRYKVALTADSQYVICRTPCAAPDTITLRPNEHLTRAY